MAAATAAAVVESVLTSGLAVVRLIVGMEETIGSQRAVEHVGQYLAMMTDGAQDPEAGEHRRERHESTATETTTTANATAGIVGTVHRADTMGAAVAAQVLVHADQQSR